MLRGESRGHGLGRWGGGDLGLSGEEGEAGGSG